MEEETNNEENVRETDKEQEESEAAVGKAMDMAKHLKEAADKMKALMITDAGGGEQRELDEAQRVAAEGLRKAADALYLQKKGRHQNKARKERGKQKKRKERKTNKRCRRSGAGGGTSTQTG